MRRVRALFFGFIVDPRGEAWSIGEVNYEGACHIAVGPSVLPEVEAAVAFSRSVGWGGLLRIGGEEIPCSRWTRASTVRSRYAAASRQVPTQLPVIYHQLEGLDLFASEDEGRFRFFWVHEPLPRWGEAIAWAARFVDGFIFDHPAWEAVVMGQMDWLPRRRRLTLPAAQLAPPGEFPPPPEGDPVFGWVGRLEVDQHRADRLPALLQAWREGGGRGRFEICGDGSLRAKLGSLLESYPVSWYPLAEWSRRLASWHAYFATAHEVGLPWPAWLAGCHGRVAWLPQEDAPSGARQAWSGVETYPSGDLEALAAALLALSRRPRRPRRERPPEPLDGSALADFLDLRQVRGQPSINGRLLPYGLYRRQKRFLARGG